MHPDGNEMNSTIEELAAYWIHRFGRWGFEGEYAAGHLTTASARLPISFKSSPYLIRVKDSTVFASSALESLSLTFLLNAEIQIDTYCPTDGTPISLHASPRGIGSSTPASCVFSMSFPAETEGDLIANTQRNQEPPNHLNRIFSSRAAAMT